MSATARRARLLAAAAGEYRYLDGAPRFDWDAWNRRFDEIMGRIKASEIRRAELTEAHLADIRKSREAIAAFCNGDDE